MKFMSQSIGNVNEDMKIIERRQMEKFGFEKYCKWSKIIQKDLKPDASDQNKELMNLKIELFTIWLEEEKLKKKKCRMTILEHMESLVAVVEKPQRISREVKMFCMIL